MTRANRLELERKLEQARRLAMEPTDPLTRERLAQLIEELEFQLRDRVRSPSPRRASLLSEAKQNPLPIVFNAWTGPSTLGLSAKPLKRLTRS